MLSRAELSSREDIFAEKYRPTELKDILYQDHVKNDFKGYIEDREFPNILLSGPAGVGKTTLMLLLYKKTIGMGNVLELNASVDNGIKVMREAIPKHATHYGKNIGILKAVLLDEADNLTNPAQHALRRTIEKYSKFCRFGITCNYPEKIIDPLMSRFDGGIYELYKIPDDLIYKRLLEIIELEDITVPSNDIIKQMVKSKRGDFRRCLGVLYSVKHGANMENFINKKSDKDFVALCIKGEFKGLRTYLDKNVADGSQLKLIVKQSADVIIDSNKLQQDIQMEFLKLIGEAEYRLVQSSDIYTISYWLCAHMSSIYNKLNNK